MSDVTGSLDFLGHQNEPRKPKEQQAVVIKEADMEVIDLSGKPFNIADFQEEIRSMSEEKNKKRAQRPNQNITGYDIAHNCIQSILYKLRHTPVPSYADKWLPIHMRSSIGTGIHEFIQRNTQQFTEIEPNIVVPSIGFYGKIDGLIGDNVLVEIKSCPWSEYDKIIKKQMPRQKDYLQAMTYAYILTNHCQETQSSAALKRVYEGGVVPKLKKYNIEKIQFIYVAHDIFAQDLESIPEMLKSLAAIKKRVKTKYNPFFFISSIVNDLQDKEKTECFTWIDNKFKAIHEYQKTGNDVKPGDPYLDNSSCFFCQYSSICNYS